MKRFIEGVDRDQITLFPEQLEDWIGVDTPVNVPGTGSEYPNWRRKLPDDWDRLLEREDVWDLARIIGEARGG